MVSRTTTIVIALLTFVGGVAGGGVRAAVAIDDPFADQPDAALRDGEYVGVSYASSGPGSGSAGAGRSVSAGDADGSAADGTAKNES